MNNVKEQLDHSRFHCVCDGVFRFTVRETNTQVELVLWNPSIRKHKTLNVPKRDGVEGKDVFALGYDHSIHDYKLVRFSDLKDSDAVDEMAMKSKQWRRVSHDLSCRPYYNSKRSTLVSLNGAVYWLTRTEDVARFDPAKEAFSIVSPPVRRGKDLSLLELEGKLCLTSYKSSCYRGYSEIWVMEDETNWVKLFGGFVSFTIDGAVCAGSNGTVYIPSKTKEIKGRWSEFYYKTLRWGKPFVCVSSLILP